MAIAMKPMLDGYAKSKPGSAGNSVLSVQSRVVCPDGFLAGTTEPSELLVCEGSATVGYKGNDKATRETFVYGWMCTGDQMRIDENEVLCFEVRTKANSTIHNDNLFRIGCKSRVEIENTILAQPDQLIPDVSVVGVSDWHTLDERILRMWIVLSPVGAVLGKKEVVTRLDAWVQERLSRYKRLRGGVGFVETIPKSPTGKVLRRVLVEGYEKEVKRNANL
ncbi:hypothetical protein BDR03DRAFT_1015035 [Suillus americanus]|nr:hypothetical protein BDR03DRAFT_1015035 [Suillus americanus]